MSTLPFSPHVKTLDLAYIALMAALIAICSWITVPLPVISAVPFTLQTFGIFLTLALLGGRRGTIAIAVYLCLGLVGLPVFAGFTGGIGRLLGVTGGYLLGFLFSGLVYWAITARFGTGIKVLLGAMLAGLVACYLFGSAWFMTLYLYGGNTISFMGVLLTCVIPYLIPDGIKLLLALLIFQRIGRYIK